MKERHLNGPQTTGRTYRNLSQPQFGITTNKNAHAVMRDGVTLLADVHRPDTDGRYPALVAASPYPRQMQDLGAPAGFIEAGATFGFFDPQERRDMYDLVEWAAAQPWCDGNVGSSPSCDLWSLSGAQRR